ncbi:MAG: T9SS type A sorting domain-containing protein, partial [Bacteroidota bacterium]
FVSTDGSCLGTAGNTESLTIIVRQEAVFDAFVKAWIDFDGNDQFDSDEVILDNFQVFNQAGFQFIDVDYTVPADAVNGLTYLRVRYESNQLSSATGSSSEGEVEDYACLILGAVPVELVRFNGYKEESDVQLEWETATEIDNRGFEVQRSANGIDFETIGWVDGRGTTLENVSYDFRDEKPSTGVNYYRLKQIDFDEAFEYSPVISVEFEEALPGTISVFPNPSTGLFNFRLPINESTDEMEIRISDMTGRVVWTITQDFVQAGTVDLSELPAGVYTMDVITGQTQFTDLISKLK